jgi:hypothetical protein
VQTLESLIAANRAAGSGTTGLAALLDGAARFAAGGINRRQLLKMGVTVGVAGFGLFGARPAKAETCSCNGTPYDYSSQCCTPTGVQDRNPVGDLNRCPDLTPDPQHAPTSNGCGPEGAWYTPLIPNVWGLANFTHCCDDHDICYGTCATVKDTCDSTFFACMQSECHSWYQRVNANPIDDILYQDCLEVAGAYYAAVHQGGSGAFNGPQQQACDCCPPPNSQNPCCPEDVCGSHCCSSTEVCLNGSCCPKQQLCGPLLSQCCPPGTQCVGGKCQSKCQYQCPCPSGPHAGQIFQSCADCLATCPSGLACFGYGYCIPIGANCPTCP